MSEMELDRLDLRILAELQNDGRISNAELAERVNLSASACLRRVQRLESRGVIAGYRAQLNRTAMGLSLSAFVRLRLR
ncbi:MAG TPA: Lrp/AsnC family transcriptional regulator, partial [Aquimonas sp.]|nr:Lrp/AsnC family transcriptional regulator [Aquimonas sp.]